MVQLGRYTLVEPIGEGGMAEVYRARLDGPMGFQKSVAIKRIRDSIVRDDEEHVRALINEARIGGQLKHPNIVEVYEFGEEAGSYFIAMELVDGVTLSELLRASRDRRCPLPPSFLIDVAMQVCHGLGYAHGFVNDEGEHAPVVHRDLKPSNIMLTRGGGAKIMDFGIAKSESNLFDTTSTGIAKGTPLYMSPEQLRGMRPLPGQSDLFSLGCILWEMVCGELLFAGRTVPEIITRVLSMPLDEEIARAEQALPGLGPILESLLARDLAQRAPDARAVEVELKHLLDWQAQEQSTAEIVQDWLRHERLPGERIGGTPESKGIVPAGTEPPQPKPSETLVTAYLRARARRRWGLGLLAAIGLALGGYAAAYVFEGTLGLQWRASDGDAHLLQGDLLGAADRWRRVLEGNPAHGPARARSAALQAWIGVHGPDKAALLESLARLREDTPEAKADKYRALARVHRWSGDAAEALVHLTWARQTLEGAERDLPAALRWELGEAAVLRGAEEAATGYFRRLARDLPPGPHADAAAAWVERLERGEGPLLHAELRWLDGTLDDPGWEALPELLRGRAGSLVDRQQERLLWAFRALAEGRYELVGDLVKPLGLLEGEPDRRRSAATALAAAAAGLGKLPEARRQVGIALDRAVTRTAAAATRVHVAAALARRLQEVDDDAARRWLQDLVEEAGTALGGKDPDVAHLKAGPLTQPPLRQRSADPRTGRLLRTPLERGGPRPSRLVPHRHFGRANRTPTDLAWPYGPAFHPFDDSPLPVFFHPGR